jgi:hypothetical protein
MMRNAKGGEMMADDLSGIVNTAFTGLVAIKIIDSIDNRSRSGKKKGDKFKLV